MSPVVRNVLIILVLAVAVFALPGGGAGAEVVGRLLGLAFAAGIALIVGRLYRENRLTIFSLGDQHRGLLYAAIATAFFCAAAAGRFFAAGGLAILVWLGLIAAASYALVRVWRHYRELV